MVPFSKLMNHFLREGFSESLTNRLGTQVQMTDEIEVTKAEGGWSVSVVRNGQAFGPVEVSTEDVLCWLYHRSF